MIFVLAIVAYGYVRYRYLTKYSRLPEEPKRQQPTIDTFLEPSNENGKSRVSYLDEFLSAIKIFGYLDKPVFHELTKSMQTQKLDSGEILFLDDNSGFTICVEGEIQVYFKIGEEKDRKQGPFSKDSTKNVVIVDGVRYQLLNNVKSGAPVSSFIGVLNLLTNPSPGLRYAPTPYSFGKNASLPIIPSDDFALDIASPLTGPAATGRRPNSFLARSRHGSFMNVRNDQIKSTMPLPSSVDNGSPARTTLQGPPLSNSSPMDSPNVMRSTPTSSVEFIAIPKESCTISIIPKESFTKVSHKYPKATTHIIEMILAKLYRVTFQTANDYLDLTSDIFETEINLNSKALYKLPRYLLENIVESLDLQAEREQRGGDKIIGTKSNDIHPNSSSIIIRSSRHFLHSSHDGTLSTSPLERSDTTKSSFLRGRRRRRSETGGDRSNSVYGFSSVNPTSEPSSVRHFALSNRNASNPGDLISNVPIAGRDINIQSPNSELSEFGSKSLNNDEETELATSLADAICSVIGITKDMFNVPDEMALSASVSSSRTNQAVTSLAGVSIVQAVENRGSKFRNFSTTGIQSNNLDENSEDSSPTNKVMDFENVKKDLADEIQIMRIPKGTNIIKTDEQTPGIYFVIAGELEVSYWKTNMDELNDGSGNSQMPYYERRNSTSLPGHRETLFTVKENQIAGYLGTLIGSKSFVDVTATKVTYAAFIPRDVFDFMIERYPRVEACIAKGLLTVLDRRLYLTDYAMEWVHCSAGTSLYMQGDLANGIYIIINGRFRSVKKEKAIQKPVILGEHGQGESLGEVEVLTKTRRLVTLVAIRDSELARIPRNLFELIALSNPSIMVNVSRMVANRVKGTLSHDPAISHIPGISPHIKDEPLYQTFSNFRTLTVLPVTHGLPVTEFGERLGLALSASGKSVKILNQSSALASLGKHAFDRLAKLKQGGYFAELEERYDIVMYLVDTIANSSWTRACIQQGDCILLIADATASPDIGEYERLLVKMKTSARTELILLHPERYVKPGLTNKWLKNRIWVHAYHHIQMQCNAINSGHSRNIAHQEADVLMDRLPNLLSRSTARLKNNLRSRVENFVSSNDTLLRLTRDSFRTKKYYHPMQVHKDDFMRLARLLTGQAIGLVLGGGGARGISHVGVIKALEDNGIPVDMIGGTSIGAFVGGLYAKDYDFVPVYGRAKTFAGRMASIWRSLLDLTIPVTSYITGHEFNRGIWKAFGDSRIEDFWIKYYANSTNITESLMEIHTSGYAWRYIRASMSLASLLPPLTDNGSMLLDGGYVDNLTVGEMKRRGAKIVIAVDVGSADDRTPMDYGDSLSGLWVLLNRFNPFSKYPNVPTMADIQMRLAYVASVNALDRAKNTEGCIYLRPPIDDYATLDFAKFDEIYRAGCNYGDKIVKKLKNEHELSGLKARKKTIFGGHPLGRRYSV